MAVLKQHIATISPHIADCGRNPYQRNLTVAIGDPLEKVKPALETFAHDDKFNRACRDCIKRVESSVPLATVWAAAKGWHKSLGVSPYVNGGIAPNPEYR